MTTATAQITKKEHAQIQLIVAAVVESTGVSVESIAGRVRTPRVAKARHLAISLIHHATKLTLNEIGSIFRRDHRSITHAIKATKQRCEKDPETAEVFASTLQLATASK